MANPKIEGLITPPFTPLHENGEINLDVIPKYVDYLVQGGSQGVFVNGTSGECLLFSVDERKKLAEIWVNAAKDKLKYVIIQVGAESIKDTQELARHAQDIGAHSIAVLPPSYYKAGSPDALADYLQEVYKAAPSMPIMYYHIPFLTNINFPLEDILLAAQEKVPTLIGAKFSHNDLADMGRSLTLSQGKYQVSYGGDGMILGALAMGAVSCVGVCFNLAGKTASAVFNAFNKGDLEIARKHQNHLQALMKVINDNAGKSVFPLATLKAVMNMKGVNVGPPRLPLVPFKQKKL
ncbi:N-acetylneuraminate lyase-like, partial [Actinia tenebrosa]|uniref:N-acetylneuraminate lyase n=1 Tax=Actinia tenebrosa TaxID=6105 RepID=A0A6P8J284_ACTTE